METRHFHNRRTVCGSRPSDPHQGVHPWLKLLLGVLLIGIFMFALMPLAGYLPGAVTMGRVIDERDLRATAIYYTDLEESAEGAETIRDSLAYPPREMERGEP
ncbi:MAG: hypothetical protein GX443_17030 [Deltaproteobacteria bacterium]|nr:hypothetical protein [Deltaproteobacteria bacterium]